MNEVTTIEPKTMTHEEVIEQMTSGLTLEQAISNIEQACLVYRGTMAEHQALSNSILKVRKELNILPPQ